MHPPIEPGGSGLLPVADHNEIYWEVTGNPQGTPVLYLHGGPGGLLGETYRRRFDPDRFWIVGMQQRGCGDSVPAASDDLDNLGANNTSNLIDDIESLRRFLRLEKWIITGVSWG